MMLVANSNGPWPAPLAQPSVTYNSAGWFPLVLSEPHLTLTAAQGLGDDLRRRAAQLAQSTHKASPSDLLYCEKRGGFQCRTCKYGVPQNATHGRCAIMDGTIHLDEGCCALWDADPAQLHLYRAPVEE